MITKQFMKITTPNKSFNRIANVLGECKCSTFGKHIINSKSGVAAG
jgi:hypothetical protein